MPKLSRPDRYQKLPQKVGCLPQFSLKIGTSIFQFFHISPGAEKGNYVLEINLITNQVHF
jgi:hypothetical protein